MGDGWDWELADRARRELERLDSYAKDRIVDRLDDIVNDEWREPPDYLEPLQGAPHQKLRIGQFRLGCRADREQRILFSGFRSAVTPTVETISGGHPALSTVRYVTPSKILLYH